VLTDDDGVTVISRLDGELLREIALRTEGVYVPAGTSALDLDSIVETHVEPLVTEPSASVAKRVPVEYYRWFVLGALAALVLATYVGATAGGAARTEA
jgi:Ca-activated chloride channel family protein